MADSPALIHTLDDLIDGLTSQGTEDRSAYLRIIRDIENGAISIIPPYRSPWPPGQVVEWLLQLLQKRANWQPGARPPAFLLPDGVPDYLGRLRFRVTAEDQPANLPPDLTKNSARVGAGRPEVGDWDEAEQYAFLLFKERGLPDEHGQVEGWRSKTDVAKAVLSHLEERALKSGQGPPDISTVRRRVPGWIEAYRARN